MKLRLLRTLVALIVSIAFVMNASAMTAGHAGVAVSVAAVSEDAMPCHDMPQQDADHDCCKKSPAGKATCVSDCCTSLLPYRFDVFRAVSFIRHRHKIARLLPLHERFCDPPSKPPSV